MHKTILALLSGLFLGLSANAASVGVRIRFGMTDPGNRDWDGSATVAPGVVERIDGWRFQETDRVLPGNSWKVSTRPMTVRRMNNPDRKMLQPVKNVNVGMVDNGVILILRDVNESSLVSIRSKQGDFSFRLSEIPHGKVIERLRGAADVERIPATWPLAAKRDAEVFPAMAIGKDGTTAAAWVAFTSSRGERPPLATTGRPTDFSPLADLPGADRLWVRLQRKGQWAEPIPVTPGGGDLFQCAVAIDGRERTWVVWSENTSYPAGALANFEIFAASIVEGVVSPKVRLSEAAGSDISPVATVDADGRIWIAWQAARGNAFRIVERHQVADGGWSPETRVSNQAGNCWSPAIAAAADGRVAIAWDTYDKGDYDVWVREFSREGNARPARPAAVTGAYESRPTLVYDRQSRLWIAWEQSGDKWGKDWAAYDFLGGSTALYADRQVYVRVLAGNEWLEPMAPVGMGLPGGGGFRRGFRNDPPLVRTGKPPTREPSAKPERDPAEAYNSYARLACDRDGRIWLVARTMEGAWGGHFLGKGGSIWVNYLASYEGERWTGPTIVPHSDDMMSSWPAVAAHPAGGLAILHSADNRQHHAAPGSGSTECDVYFSRLEMPEAPVTLKLRTARNPPGAPAAPTPATLEERAARARSRAFKIRYDDKPLSLIVGEFHRHTEISGDGRDDSSLEDMWRYGMDVADMDWIGNGDHDNGHGQYTWWLTQKTTDAYRLPGRFDPVFSYERSVGYPEGHRNVVFSQRGVRPLFRLPRSDPERFAPAPDTLMLYDYLRQFSGVCASHTSSTTMGTDWRNNAPDVEPMVEIYQGERQNYERPGAPRAPSENDAMGGWRPRGFINLALKMGYKFSFVSSSDHNSTHTSFAMIYVEDRSREALLRAMRARHTYGATDNIIADLRSMADGRDYMMGDEFATKQPPTLRLRLIGTAPFSKITLIKDDEEVHVVHPKRSEVELSWTDPNPTAGRTSYYYFRGEQEDGELVWVSPMWITYVPER